jgi:cell division septal protein FtsQ
MLPLKVKRAMEAIKKRKRKERKHIEKKRKRKKKRIKKKGATLLSFIHTCAHVLAPAVFIVIICAHV